MTTTKTLLKALFARAAGSFDVTFWDGEEDHYGPALPWFKLILTDADVVNMLANAPDTWFGEAYTDGKIEIEGDLADLIALSIRSRTLLCDPTLSTPLQAARRAVRASRSPERQELDVRHHYDLGNEFFKLWLDRSLTYSCAYFRSAADTLDAAQLQKVDHTLRKLRLKPGETLLDIGSGWGALIMRAAEGYEARALGITLSDEQFRGSCERIRELGLEDRADVRLSHYAALAESGAQFDKIASVGMIEHVGKAHLGEFTDAVRAMLKPGGLALLHNITMTGTAPLNAWSEQYIFPGTYIPTLSEMIKHYSARGLHVWDVENLGPHYRLTLDAWSERFERCAPTVRAEAGEEFVRMWRLYLRSSSAAFREGLLEVHQVLVSNGAPHALPLTRSDLYVSE